MVPSLSTRRRVPAGLAWAALLGGVHAVASLYWAAGGTVLLWTLGEDLTQSLRGHEWLLLPVGAVKAFAAVGPWLLARHGWPWRRTTRGLCWLGAVLLVGWGSANTVVGMLVLGAVIEPGEVDRAGMIGHAFVWDPLFLAWGVCLAVGLFASRARGPR
ncbi:DUF3995 domain-containing protein [Aeromicrobium duanguangcaii]|uniref:DUF3995 domain-containing protein n=1 Tax=Aeromicrobium duanguangcaii TaxID=2968086 RepID=A0ABY5KI01_9ACTN|nr:DUF3995 domain-containing protein [Aeromicrobium duanguangcaii]MCD9153534.1 DUF3995 domain-containing protein [Aeromicrobium duanguangcaii]UUI69378.1 DUF3995 domain-containing protein [Aeromicrobium duanguangcaii]